jgi:catechol 2,3-dioxygenase-like lactoylglutathione lyase family enzyme
MSEIKFICPLICVADIQVARHFYEEILQQKVKYDFGENVTFVGDFAIHLKTHYRGLIEGREIQQGGNNFELFFEHDDLEAMVQKLIGNQVEFVHEIREEPWRQKVVRFYDPDHNIIEVGESLEFLVRRLKSEGLRAEEIAAQTGIPLSFIQAQP